MSTTGLEGAQVELSLVGEDGTTTLSDWLGSAGTVVYFLRTSTCAICVRHASTLADMTPALNAAGWQVVAVVPEGVEAAADLKARRNLPFAVLAGNPEDDARSNAFFGERFGIQRSGTLVVDAERRATYAKAATVPVGSFDAGEVRAVTGV